MIFHETIFPFISSAYSSSPHSNISLPHLFPPVASPLDSLFPSVSPSIDSQLVPSSSFLATELIPSFTPSGTDLITLVEIVLVVDPIPPVAIVPLAIPTSSIPTPFADDVAPASLSTINFVEPVTLNPPIRRSHKITKPPSYL